MQVAAACEEAGLDIFNIHAGFRGAPGLDIYNDGKFLYPGSPAGNFGGCSGPWSRLISNRFIADIATASSLPIIGSGGISKWEHIVESIICVLQLYRSVQPLCLRVLKLFRSLSGV